MVGPGGPRWSRTQEFLRTWWRQDDPGERRETSSLAVDPEFVSMLRQLGVAMLDGGEATNDVESKLREIARAYDHDRIRVLVLPTMLIIQVETEDGMRTDIDQSLGRMMRLAQVAAVLRLVDEACTGEPDPQSR